MKSSDFNESSKEQPSGAFQYNYPHQKEDGLNHFINFRFIELYEQKKSARHNPDKAEATNAKKGRKTLGSITLYNPGGISMSYSQNWDKTDGMMAEYGSMANKNTVTGAGLDMLATKGAQFAQGAAKLAWGANLVAESGYAVNPFLGVSYISPDLRTQSFTFNFTPRNEPEAIEVMNILDAFKYYTHPEYGNFGKAFAKKMGLSSKKAEPEPVAEGDKGTGSGIEKFGKNVVDDGSDVISKLGTMADKFILKTPALFDINFINAEGGVNENLFRFGPAVCTDVTCNYSPAGVWRSFRNGVPTQVDLSLSFQEMEILTKDKIEAGY